MNTIQSADTTAPGRPGRSILRRAGFAIVVIALLILGLIQLVALFSDDEATPALRMDNNYLVASGMLRVALDQPDNAPQERLPGVGPRSRNAEGQQCRRFVGRPAEEGTIAGTACLVEDEWRVVEVRQQIALPKLQ